MQQKVVNIRGSKAPSVTIELASLGVIGEPFRLQLNENQGESKWTFFLNKDCRYVSKFWIQGTKNTRDALRSWLIPFAFALEERPDTDLCDMEEFRQSFNKMLKKAVSAVDKQ